MSAPYDSVLVARYIVAAANDKDLDINLTKVQKLLYIAYGVWLAIVNDIPVVNEKPQAWPYGPVFPRTRKHLLKADLYEINIKADEFKELKKDEDFVGLIDFVLKHYGHNTAGELTAWSHKEGSPWEVATCQEGFDWGDRIDDMVIKSYFKHRVLKKKDEN